MRKMVDSGAEDKRIYIGLEDSHKTYRLNVRQNGMEVHQTSMPASYAHLKGYFENRFSGCDIHVIYEAGFKGFELYDQLTADGIQCVVTPPNKVTEAKDNRVKTDTRDARRLAKNLENGDFVACHVPDRERREDREVSRALVQIGKELTRTKNRIRGLLRFHGLESWDSTSRWTDREYLQLRSLKLKHALEFALHQKLDLLDTLLAMRVRLIAELKLISQKERYQVGLKTKQSVPGIGWLTAIRLTLEWGDLSRFLDGKHLASFSGLTGSEFSTGQTIHKGHITGQSAEFIRSWLIECAWRAIRIDPILLEKYNAVRKSSGSAKKAIVAVARKMVVRMHAIETKGGKYQLGLIS